MVLGVEKNSHDHLEQSWEADLVITTIEVGSTVKERIEPGEKATLGLEGIDWVTINYMLDHNKDNAIYYLGLNPDESPHAKPRLLTP